MSSSQVVVYAGSTEYGDYRIVDMTYEGRPARVLFSNESAGQSGLALDDEPELLFDYNQRFLEIVESTRPKTVLIIGGGAFTLPRALVERFPNIRIDVIEIDPLLYELAKQYFDAPQEDRLRVFSQDGRSFVDKTTKTYDCIIVDAFNGYTIPRSLISRQAAERYRGILAPNGIVTVNFIATYRSLHATLAHDLSATFGDVFTSTQIFPADRGYWTHAEQNLLLVSGREEPNLDYLQSSVATLGSTPGTVLEDEPT